jgi:hypothetical protein
MKKLALSLIATLLFVVILILVYYLHIRFFAINVVFYAAIADGVITTVVAGAGLFAIGFFRALGRFEKFQLIAIWLLAGYAFAISVPTVIDRSLSFYILEKLQQRGGGIRHEAFEQVFTQEYVKEHRLVDVRLTEQLESGTIKIKDGCIFLTDKGERLVLFSRYFRQHWLPKKRLLMGEYTDDLTDPFRHSSSNPDYLCKGSA